LRKRTVAVRSEVGVEEAACFEAKDEVVACSGLEIEDSRRQHHDGVLGDRRMTESMGSKNY
jgi:hypothetical protein